MKPNFILELSHDGIRLKSNGSGASEDLGHVALSDPDFDAKVTDMRNGVAEQSDFPMATELRIPDSEILYTTLDDPEFDPKSAKADRAKLRHDAVCQALEGMTPYALNDLNFTWKVKGKGELCVAAVARETLAEAEQFAASRGFNPVSFAAMPGKDKFKGSVDFGATALQIQRDRAAALEKAEAERKAVAPEPPKAEPVVEPSAPKVETTPPKTADVPDQPPAKTDSAKAADDAAPNAPTLDDPAPNSDTKPSEKAPAQQEKPSKSMEKSQTASGRVTPPVAGGDAAKPRAEKNVAPKEPEAAEKPDLSAAAEKPVEMPRVGFSQPRVNDPLPPLDDAADGAAVLDDVPPMPVAFASRRKPVAKPPMVAGAKSPGPLTPGVAATPRPSESAPKDTPARDDSKDSRLSRIAARFAVSPDTEDALPPPPPRRAPIPGGGSAKSVDKPGAPRPTRAAALPDTRDAAASLSPINDSDGNPLPPPARDTISARMAKGGKLNEAEAMTVFGARDVRPGRSFAPLVIGLIVAALLAIGVWTAFFLAGDDQVTNTPEAAAPEETANLTPAISPAATMPDDVTVDEPTETAPTDQPTEDAQPLPSTDVADLTQSQEPEQSGTERVARSDSTVATLGPIAPAPPNADGLPLTESAPPPLANDPLQRPPNVNDDSVGRYATTGIWVAPPDAPSDLNIDRLEDIHVASTDANLAVGAFQPVTEIAAPNAPRIPARQLPPAPSGQSFDLDARGLVRATPDGAISPDGILITAGRPDKTPPARPDRPTALTPALENQPDLPRIRPRDRPSDLAEETNLTPETTPEPDTRLAALQPRARPADAAPTGDNDIQDRARAAAFAVTGASTATPQAPVTAPVPRKAPADLVALRPVPPAEPAEEAVVPEPISPYAVAQSRLPKGKPRNFDRLVAQARAKAPEVKEQQVTRVAAPAAVVTPSIPSRASVAKQATVKNAINLGKLNLIGVYGSTSNRRALVRLPSGRFVKVKVGDSIDGGRIAAIGQSELSYTKSGRRVTLQMPQG
ncbi:hypothetical protein [Oceaniglobus ichthyenteri]|uniref:hypothetical protein n=1 Tax=Oceaniglobus ichthyenteri TaxID=2136177 RepID=UPI000F83DC94|nr:hypothetical protein [Oceaniglobus ichthyenteri]